MDLLRQIVKQLDEIDAEIEKAAKQKPLLKTLRRQRADFCRKWAEHLLELGPGANFPDDNPAEVYDDGGREVWPTWLVTGTLSKRGRPLAEEWMRVRNVPWEGDIQSLRREVANALYRRELVPEFGLGTQLSIVLR